jgi:hypothetical protein
LKEVQSLFLADIHRAIESLRKSLAMGPSAVHQSALYARDLADALHGIDLPRHAELALAVSSHFSQGRPGIEQPAAELIRVTAALVEGLLEGHSIESDETALKNLAQAISVFEDQPIDLDSPAFALSPDLSRPPTEPAEQVAEVVLNESDPFRAPMPQASEKPASLSVPDAPEFDLEWGLRGLKMLEAELTEALNPERARRVRHRITDQSNWLLSLGQKSVADFLAGLACNVEGASGVYVDHEVGQALFQSLSQMRNVRSISVGQQQLTVFMEIECDPTFLQYGQGHLDLEEQARRLFGRLEVGESGLRLVVPSSLRRIRVVPFVRSGMLYALSWAQFLGAATLGASSDSLQDLLGQAVGARLELQAKAGGQPLVFYAHEVRPFEFANIAALPSGVDAESGVCGLALGSDPQPMVCLFTA